MTTVASMRPRQVLRLPLPCNKHGHYVVSIIGEARSGVKELESIEEQGISVRDSARDLLLSCHEGSYDCKHWLIHTRFYNCALVPLTPYRRGEGGLDCTTAGYLEYGQQFGYTEAKAGALFRVIENIAVSTIGPPLCNHLSPLVTALKDNQGNPWSLCLRHYPETGWTLTATDGDISHEWRDPGLLIYNIP